MQRKIVIIGATSAIAQAVSKILAERGELLFLVGRHPARLASIATDLQIRSGKKVGYIAADLNNRTEHAKILQQALQVLGNIDVVLIAHGSLGDQMACQNDFEKAFNEINTNFISTASLLTVLANYFELQGKGCIAVISSVAGDRGRQSNYVYGAAKAAISTFLQGLRNRLYKAGVNVLTIKPGFVDTPMTKNFKKGLLWSDPQSVANKIVKAIDNNRQVIYTPGYWRLIMGVIKIIPERIFCRLSL